MQHDDSGLWYKIKSVTNNDKKGRTVILMSLQSVSLQNNCFNSSCMSLHTCSYCETVVMNDANEEINV